MVNRYRDPYHDSEYKKRRAAEKKRDRELGTPCAICGEPFDWTAPQGSPLSYTRDHLTPLSRGGRLDGPTRPVHQRCNSRRGNRPILDGKQIPRPQTSRDWYS